MRENPYDTSDRALARASQADPWVMYLVTTKASLKDPVRMLSGAARATVGAWLELGDDERFSKQFAAWREESYRKVALVARPRQFEEVRKLPSYQAAEEVLALPPRRKSEQEEILRKLQAHFGPLELDSKVSKIDPLSDIKFLIPAALKMSLGKAMAQVAHAVLMAYEGFEVTKRAEDLTFSFELVSDQSFERMKEEDVLVVRDAGFTEIEHGSETVMAFV